MTWEDVPNIEHPGVRRFKVDGGWIYAIEYVNSPPCACFVPDQPMRSWVQSYDIPAKPADEQDGREQKDETNL